ncbi:hypothetical protein [Streptomyces sp. NPDC088196]
MSVSTAAPWGVKRLDSYPDIAEVPAEGNCLELAAFLSGAKAGEFDHLI